MNQVMIVLATYKIFKEGNEKAYKPAYNYLHSHDICHYMLVIHIYVHTVFTMIKSWKKKHIFIFEALY